MNYRHFFDDQSDPIIIINYDGLHSYSNKSAKSLSITNNISKIGSSDFQRNLHLVLDNELDTPVTLQLNDDLGIGADYEVKIMTIKSSFILHFINNKNQSHIGILKHRLILMLKDELEIPLNDLFISTDELLSSIGSIDTTEKNRELLNKTLEDGGELMNSVWRIKILSELYTSQDIKNQEKIRPIALLGDAIQKLDELAKKKSLSVRIEKAGTEVTGFMGNKHWLAFAIKESLKAVMDSAKDNEEINVKLDIHGYFISLNITNTPVMNPLKSHYAEQRVNGLEIQKFDDLQNNLDFNLFLAIRVVELQGGKLKCKSSVFSKTITIELPVGSAIETNEMDGLKQAKLYAIDLALLKDKTIQEGFLSQNK